MAPSPEAVTDPHHGCISDELTTMGGVFGVLTTAEPLALFGNPCRGRPFFSDSDLPVDSGPSNKRLKKSPMRQKPIILVLDLDPSRLSHLVHVDFDFTSFGLRLARTRGVNAHLLQTSTGLAGNAHMSSQTPQGPLETRPCGVLLIHFWSSARLWTEYLKGSYDLPLGSRLPPSTDSSPSTSCRVDRRLHVLFVRLSRLVFPSWTSPRSQHLLARQPIPT